ncbi:MAG TPA: hemolysin family protein [Candidatus Treponema faecavium]|nr:hemolysin family protein [Candidatus Treponema faecavium]
MSSGEPPSDSLWGVLIAAAVLIVFSMIFSASESAFLSINKLRVRFLRRKKDPRAIRAGKLLDNRERLINTLLVGNNIVNIGISALLTAAALELFGAAGVGIATLVSTVLLLIFGEITPKTVGSRHPEPVAFLFSRVVTFFSVLLYPVVALVTMITRGIVSLTGIRLSDSAVSFTEEDIRNLIDVGEEEGVLDSGEKRMMHRVFKFTDLAAKDIMAPRMKIQAIPATMGYHDVLELSERTRYSRFPVYRDDIDNIVGILYVKDLLFFDGTPESFSVMDFVRPPLFVLGSKKMSSVQQMLRENRQTLAVVVDEYSGTDGILTMEDIAREIFGAISDEYETEPRPGIIESGASSVLVDGTVRLIDIEDKFGITLHSEYYETLGGYLSEKLDKVPCAGDSMRDSGCVFTVVEADERHASQIRIEREPEESAEAVRS